MRRRSEYNNPYTAVNSIIILCIAQAITAVDIGIVIFCMQSMGHTVVD